MGMGRGRGRGGPPMGPRPPPMGMPMAMGDMMGAGMMMAPRMGMPMMMGGPMGGPMLMGDDGFMPGEMGDFGMGPGFGGPFGQEMPGPGSLAGPRPPPRPPPRPQRNDMPMIDNGPGPLAILGVQGRGLRLDDASVTGMLGASGRSGMGILNADERVGGRGDFVGGEAGPMMRMVEAGGGHAQSPGRSSDRHRSDSRSRARSVCPQPWDLVWWLLRVLLVLTKSIGMWYYATSC